MVSLIINADDLGIAPSTDKGIFEAHSRGVVTSATAFATSPRFLEATTRADAQSLPVGLHLNLTLGTCAADPADVSPLVDEGGSFRHTARDLPRLLCTKPPDSALLAAIHKEFEAQFARASDTGLAFTHFDSHQHVHLIPAIFRIAAELAPRFGYSRTRLPKEPLTLFHLRHRPLAGMRRLNPVKWLWLRLAVRRIDNPFIAPDAYFGALHSGLADAATLLGTLRALRQGTTAEIGIHPGYPCPPEEAVYPQPFVNEFIASPRRREELDALTDPRVARAVTQRGIRLISYADLSRGGSA